MEDFLNSEAFLNIVAFVAGALFAAVLMGVNKLIDSIKDSSNKWDDKFLPVLEAIKKALEEKK